MDELEEEAEEACYCETDDECEEYTITLGTMHDPENKENANSAHDSACPPIHLHGEQGGSDVGGRRRGEETEGHAVVDGDNDCASARERESCDSVAGDEGDKAWKAAGALRDGSGERVRKTEGVTPDGRDASSSIDIPVSKKVVLTAGMLAKRSPERKPTELHSRASASNSVCVSCGGCAPTCGCAWQRLRQQVAEKAAGAAEKCKTKMPAAVPCGRHSEK